MATNALAIINAALREIGEPVVTAAADTSASRSLNAAYDEARRGILRKYVWGFNKKRATLTAGVLSTEEALEWDYVYTLPADWLATVSISHNGDFDSGVIKHSDFENGRILCDHNTAYILYLFDNTTTTAWDASFDEAFPLYLALKSNLQITNSADLTDRLAVYLAGKELTARTNSARDKGPQRRPMGNWNRSRQRAGGLLGGWGQFP